MRPVRSAACAAILVGLWVATAWADWYSIAVSSPAPSTLAAEPSTPMPVLMLLGGKDDWTPAAPCEALAQAASRAGRNVTAVLYPDAYHHFDGAEVMRRTVVPDARGGLGATIEYDPRAHEDAEKQVRAFLAANLGK